MISRSSFRSLFKTNHKRNLFIQVNQNKRNPLSISFPFILSVSDTNYGSQSQIENIPAHPSTTTPHLYAYVWYT